MKILLHQCCAPCSIHPLQTLISQGHDVHGYFYNPNIHPFTEYKKRKDTLIDYNNHINIPYTIEDEYGLRPFIKMAESTDHNDAGKRLERCRGCYLLRLHKIAQKTVAIKCDAFTTSLLYSRRQSHKLIVELAENIAQEYNTIFWYEDYRDGWQAGIDKSKELEMYRQNYCGCIYSEEERYIKANW